jgi:acyl-CoA dehydrogenase
MFDIRLGDEHELFRQTCLRFADQEIAPHVTEWEEAGEFPRELYAKAAQAGLLGIGLPEEYGGSGGDALHAVIRTEALLRPGSSGVVAGLGSLGIALPPIALLGSEEQKRRIFPEVASGQKIAALAITEPAAGSDVAGIATRAERRGDRYLLRGSKLFITSGVRADYVTVLARTGPDKHGGLTFFIVEKGMKGYSVSRALKKTGWWASDTAELAFDDVEVPVENRVGDEGSGFVALMRNFQSERLGLAVFGHATAEIVLEDAIAYAKQRQAFGRPIAGFQVIRHRIAEMATKVHAAKSINYDLARRVQSGEYLVLETSMAKNFSSKVAQEVCYDAVQILGGMGFMRETRVERLSRDARLLPIGGGTTEIMNEIIAKSLGL